MSQNKEPNFSESQEAIFNFLFVLIQQYNSSMPHTEAVDKACDWLTSLANDVRAKNKDVVAEQAMIRKKLSDNV